MKDLGTYLILVYVKDIGNLYIGWWER